MPNFTWQQSHRIHQTGIFTYILPYKSTIHVGKYVSPMDGLGMKLVCFFFKVYISMGPLTFDLRLFGAWKKSYKQKYSDPNGGAK